MASRIKEDEKNERTIRGLLKLPPNRRCINCNNLGPQYVCTNFWTFICTNCSGLHREFTHRVKSVSMAKFTTQEVIALQEGGNERAKELYFKEWDPQRHSVPDSSNIDRLRDFIKHVYVDRRYSGERNVDRPPQAKLGEREDSSENRKVDSYRGGSRSPPYNDTYNERAGYGGRSVTRSPGYDGGDYKRSPGYDGGDYKRSPGYDGGDYKRSPGGFEVVDEKRRDDRFGNGNQNRRFEESVLPYGVPKPEGRSPNNQKDASSPPIVRPVRDILGDDMPTLRVGDPPKPNGTRISDSPAQTRRTSSSSSMGSSDGSSVQQKGASSGSLIDFDADPEPTVPTATNQSVPQQTTSKPADGGNWASFDFTNQQIAPQATANGTTLESMLGQLSAPGSAPGGNMSTLPLSGIDSYPKIDYGVPTMPQQRPPLFPTSSNQFANPRSNAPGGNMSTLPLSAIDSYPKIDYGVPTMPQQRPPLFPTSSNQFVNPRSNAPSVGAVNQPWGSPQEANLHAAFTAPTGYPSQVAPRPSQEMSASLLSQPPAEAKTSGRNALPEDLFASVYPLGPTSFPGWQGHPHLGMGYGMQYPTSAAMPTFQPPANSSNPFDFMNQPASNQAATFPSMASLQGALPNIAHPSSTSNFGTQSSQWMPPQQLSYQSAAPQSPYMMQQVPGNMPQQVPSTMIPVGHQGIRGPGFEGAFFGTSMDQHLAPRYPQPGTANSFGSGGGNPFG